MSSDETTLGMSGSGDPLRNNTGAKGARKRTLAKAANGNQAKPSCNDGHTCTTVHACTVIRRPGADFTFVHQCQSLLTHALLCIVRRRATVGVQLVRAAGTACYSVQLLSPHYFAPLLPTGPVLLPPLRTTPTRTCAAPSPTSPPLRDSSSASPSSAPHGPAGHPCSIATPGAGGACLSERAPPVAAGAEAATADAASCTFFLGVGPGGLVAPLPLTLYKTRRSIASRVTRGDGRLKPPAGDLWWGPAPRGVDRAETAARNEGPLGVGAAPWWEAAPGLVALPAPAPAPAPLPLTKVTTRCFQRGRKCLASSKMMSMQAPIWRHS